MAVNKVILLGRVGKDPQVNHTEHGKTVANFSIATSEQWKDKTTGEKKQVTEWHRIVAWDKLGDFVSNYITKGRQLYVEGKLVTRSWEDKDGVKKYTTEVIANKIDAVGAKDSNDEQSEIPV